MAEKTIVEVAEEINGKVTGVKTELEQSINSKASQEEVQSLKTQVEELKTLEEKNKTLETQLAELKGEITAIREISTQTDTKNKGELIKYLKSDDRTNQLKSADKRAAKRQGFENVLSVKMSTADVLPLAGGAFNQLFGNFIDPEIYEDPKRPEFMLDLVSVRVVSGTERIWFQERVNEVGNAQFINEGDPKPDINAQWQQNDAPIEEVAESWFMTERLLNHAPSVFQNFNDHATDLINLQIDAGLFSGDGIAPNISGVTTLASAFVVPPQLAAFYTFANIFDVINAVATSIKLNDFMGEMTVVLNPVWEAVMKGIKDQDGNYIMPPFVAPDLSAVSGMRLVFNTLVGDDEILVGILPNFKVVFSETVTFGEGFINDDFTRNQVRYRLAAWLGTYLPANLQGSIVFDDISTILAAISAP